MRKQRDGYVGPDRRRNCRCGDRYFHHDPVTGKCRSYLPIGGSIQCRCTEFAPPTEPK